MANTYLFDVFLEEEGGEVTGVDSPTGGRIPENGSQT